MKRICYLSAILTALVLAAFAREFVMPKLVAANSMTCRDFHPQEKMTVGADAYDTAAKASLFHPAMLQHSVMPVLVVFTNDGDETVVLSHVHFELVTRDRAKAEPFTQDDLQRAFTQVQAPGSRTQDTLPIPLPGRTKTTPAACRRRIATNSNTHRLPPAPWSPTADSGLSVFDVGDFDDPANGARLFRHRSERAHGAAS